MHNIAPALPFPNTSDHCVEKKQYLPGSMQHRKVIAIITDEQFSQFCVQNRIRKLIIYSPTKIQGFTDAGNETIIHASWPYFASQKHFAKYLEHAFIVITQMNDGEYQLRASIRILGGGNDQSTGKNTQKPTTTKPPIKFYPPPQKQIPNTQPIVKQTVVVPTTPSEFDINSYLQELSRELNKVLDEYELSYNKSPKKDEAIDKAMIVVNKILNYDFFSDKHLQEILGRCIYRSFPEGFSKIFQKLKNKTISYNIDQYIKSFINEDLTDHKKEMFKYLFDHGHFSNLKSNYDYGNHYLAAAASAGWPDIVKHMLEQGADPNLYNGSKTAIDCACGSYKDDMYRDGKIIKEIVDLLIAAGEKPSTENNKIVEKSCKYGWNDIFIFLVNNSVTFTSQHLLYAIQYERGEMIPSMIANGADPTNQYVQKRLLQVKPHIRELVDKHTKDNPEFLKMIKMESVKIIRSLQGDLYSKVESAQKLQELEDTLTRVLSSSSVFREFYYKLLPELEIAPKRKTIIDCVSKKLNEVMGSSFYFDAGKGILRTTEIEEELKEAILASDAIESKIISQQQKEQDEKVRQRELLKQQLQQQADFEKQRMEQEKQRIEQEKQRMEQERQIAENQLHQQANALQQRKKEADELKQKLDQIKDEIRYY